MKAFLLLSAITCLFSAGSIACKRNVSAKIKSEAPTTDTSADAKPDGESLATDEERALAAKIDALSPENRQNFLRDVDQWHALNHASDDRQALITSECLAGCKAAYAQCAKQRSGVSTICIARQLLCMAGCADAKLSIGGIEVYK